jgi:hypothetical protein
MKFGVISLLTAGLLSLAAPAFAHHSGAMFDGKKTVSVVGTVKSFEWTNPHSWLEVMVKDKDGKPVQWSIEMNGPEALFRQGFRQDNPKVGDRVTVVMHPLRDGRRGGSVVSVLLPDGKLIGFKST